MQHNLQPTPAMRAFDAIGGGNAAVATTANAVAATWLRPFEAASTTSPEEELRRFQALCETSCFTRHAPVATTLDRTRVPQAVPESPSTKDAFRRKTVPLHHKATSRLPKSTRTRQAQPVNRERPDLPVRISPLPGPLRGFLPPVPGIQPDPPAHLRTPENAAGLHETRSTRELRGQQRRMDWHKERDMDMAGKMSGIDRHGASGLKNARDLPNVTGARCALPVGVNSKSGELPEHVPLSGHERVERTSDRMQPARSAEPKWYQPFRAGRGARVLRLAASLFAFAMLGTALPAAAQTDIWTATLTPADLGVGFFGCSIAISGKRVHQTPPTSPKTASATTPPTT